MNNNEISSCSRQQKRAKIREDRKHDKFLIELLRDFYAFLDGKPKPTDEEVRSKFRKSETIWKMYCTHNNLGIKTSLLFNARVSYEWERRYARRNH